MKWTNKHDLPEPLCRCIEVLESAHENAREGIVSEYSRSMTPPPEFTMVRSVTQLIDSPFIYQLRQKHRDEVVSDYSDRIWALMGCLAHAAISRNPGESDLTERPVFTRIKTDSLDVLIYGTPDSLHLGKNTSKLTDYKVTSVYAIKDGPRTEWVAQLNLYAFLIHSMNPERNWPSMEIVAILRDWGERFSGISPSQVKTIPIELWSFARMQEYIMGRILVHLEAEKNNGKPCSIEESWSGRRCEKYCEVNKWCPVYQAREPSLTEGMGTPTKRGKKK